MVNEKKRKSDATPTTSTLRSGKDCKNQPPEKRKTEQQKYAKKKRTRRNNQSREKKRPKETVAK